MNMIEVIERIKRIDTLVLDRMGTFCQDGRFFCFKRVFCLKHKFCLKRVVLRKFFDKNKIEVGGKKDVSNI